MTERDPEALIHAVLDGQADDADFAALERWLREDPANVRALARAAYLDQRTREQLEEDDLSDLVGKPVTTRNETQDAGANLQLASGSAPEETRRRRAIGMALAMLVLALTAGVVGYYLAVPNSPTHSDDADADARDEAEALAREQAGQHAYQRWLAYSQRLRQDPDLLAYYAFEPGPDQRGVLRNDADATAGLYDGRLGSADAPRTVPAWARGRFPGQMALEFNGADKQHVVIPHADGLNLAAPCTVSLWVYNDTPVWTAHLLTKRDYTPEGGYYSNLAIAWIGVDPVHHAGQRTYYHTFEFGDVGPNRAWTGPHESPEGLPQSPRWVNLTITYDGEQIIYYRDGERTDTKPVERNRDMADIAGDLILGDSTTAGSQLKNSFDGRIDELVLLRRVWTDAEARAFYEAGKPAAE